MGFALGFEPRRAAAIKAEMRASARYATVTAKQDIAPAKSLTAHRLRHLEQGQAGTCWAHAATQLAEVTAVARGLDAFPVCRRLVAWQGKQYEGGGNPTDGGAGGDALRAMSEVGLAHESLLPYSDARRDLGTRPPKPVFDDAAKSHLSVPVDVRSLDEALTLVDSDTAVCLGIWWPWAWDDRHTFMTGIGQGVYGHELLICGYAKAGVFNEYEWVQLDNWHGLLYPPLSPELAAKVPGYKPITENATSDFWVARSVLETVMGYAGTDLVSASDVAGLDALQADWSGVFLV